MMRQRGLIAATGITSGVDGEHHHQDGDAVNPRIVDHGSRVGVPVVRLVRILHPAPPSSTLRSHNA